MGRNSSEQINRENWAKMEMDRQSPVEVALGESQHSASRNDLSRLQILLYNSQGEPKPVKGLLDTPV